MDIFEAIEKRHSYRGGFTEHPIPADHLKQIVQAGIQAPSGCSAQSTSFVIVDDAEKLAGIAAIVDKPVVREAKAVIVCVVDHTPVYGDLAFGVEDCAAAVENILLAVTALGYATVWLDGALRTENRAEQIAALLDIPDNRQVRVMLPLGVPKERCTQREKKPFAERAWFNTYGSP